MVLTTREAIYFNSFYMLFNIFLKIVFQEYHLDIQIKLNILSAVITEPNHLQMLSVDHNKSRH